jgi:ribosomal protein S12 methylthiotransferase
MRGKLQSRPAHHVLAEAERLVKAGVKELLVISQDTSAYGLDLGYAERSWRGRQVRTRLTELCRELGELDAWIRLHYVYPYPHVDELIPLMAEGKVLPYLDIPFQHASPRVLKAMRRPGNQERVLERIRAWRKICPELALRSTFIVGFPGETEEDFRQLLDWLEAAELDRVGCFKYENVEGAAANHLPNHVPEEVKEERWHRFMQAQQEISARRLQQRVGTMVEVLIDAIDEEGTAHGRTYAEAPEIDGTVHIEEAQGLGPGDMVTALIEDADEYDLWATLLPVS